MVLPFCMCVNYESLHLTVVVVVVGGMQTVRSICATTYIKTITSSQAAVLTLSLLIITWLFC